MRELNFRVTEWVWGSTAAALACAGGVAGERSDDTALNLQSAERRRLTPLAALALSAGERLVSGRPSSAVSSVPLVYASRDGDGTVLLKLLSALRDRQPVSPTQFHNSVHNAPAGYWSIGLNSKAATTALAAGDDTAEVALVEAGLQACVRNGAVLMVVAQQAFPQELRKARAGADDFVLAAWCVPPHFEGGWHCCVMPGYRSDTLHGRPLVQSLVSAVSINGQHGLRGRRAVERLAAMLEISDPP